MKKLKLSLVLTLALAVLLALSACTAGMMQTCTVHRDLNKDTYCDVCSAYVPVNCVNHLDENHDGMCDTKGCTMMMTPMHYDNDCNGKCDVEECGKSMKIKHEDADADGFCDKCETDLTLNCEHEDEDGDYFCDLCNKQLEICNHVDEDGDLTCDICGREIELSTCEHVDGNFDGKCDKCKEQLPDTLPLVTTGKMNFQFVLFSGAPINYAQMLDSFIGGLQNSRLEVKDRVADIPASITDYEILIGNCTSRGEEYQFDEHEYGPKGYAIKIIGTKIVVLFGSENAFDDALNALKTEVIGLADADTRIRNRYITDKNSIERPQDDYRVTTLTLNGQDMKGFTIAVDKTNEITLAAAEELRDMLYNDTGYWFEIVSIDEADKSIVIRLEEKDPDPEQRYNNKGFKVVCSDNRIDFIAEYATAYLPFTKKDPVTGTDVVERYALTVDYFSGKLYKAENMTLNLVPEADDYEQDIRYVYYKDFGAISYDDKDDSEAIRAAHEYANLGGHKVIAEAGAYYDIFAMEKTITVKTDVDWKDATFYLHDNTINPSQTTARGTNIFTIAREEGAVRVPGLADKIAELNASGGLDASTFTSFNLNFGRPMILSVYNGNHINYIRYGVNASDGGGQSEVILVDKDGNVDDNTPLMFDFEYITGITCYPVDDLPITIEGGVFRTSPFLSDTPQAYTSYGRGIQCGRSNTTFKNVRHILENEGNYNYDKHYVSSPQTEDYGCPYGGFYSTTRCNNVTYVGCQMSAHIVYKGSNGAGMGTYDVSPGNSTNIVYDKCYQDEANFFNKTYVKDENDNPTTKSQNRWGVMGSSGNKNVTFLNSRLTRMDAHGGIHNVYIIGSELTMIRVDGTGIFYMENSIVHGSSTYVSLREDYGGFWHGNVILKDCKTTVGTTNLFTNTWYNHYFGYPTAYPTNILIDNFQAGSLSGGSFYFNDGATFTPYEKATVRVFGTETSTSGGVTSLSGIYNGAHQTMIDYLPATSNNNVLYNSNGNLITEQLYYENGAPVVVPNKNQTPAPERLIIKNCDDSINFVIPDKEKYPWFANMVVSVNQTTECQEHFDCFGDGDNLCDDCGAEMTECTEHFDGNNDGRCAICFTDVPIKCDKHIDKELNGKCDICNVLYICSGHVDWDENTICDKCGGVLGCPGEEHIDLGAHADKLGNHKDENVDQKCDLCAKDMTDTADCAKNTEANGKCDSCGKAMTEDATCTANGDGYCDICTKLIPKCEKGTCVDEINENKLKIRDGKCDKCKADIVALITPCDECVDADEDGSCDMCLKTLPCEHVDLGAHVDEAEDGTCDKCGGEASTENTCTKSGDGICDKCEKPMPAEE